MARKVTTGTESETSDRRVSWSREAFQMAYRDHSGAVYAAARGFCGSGLAGDVTVEVFLQLWRHPEQQDSARASLRTLLLRVTHEVSADTIRSETARRTPEAQATARPVADLDVADLGYADQSQVAADERSLVDQPLRRLSRDEWDAIVTAYYGGCTYREAAAALGLDEATVRSRIRAGLHHLRVARARSSSSGSPDIDGGDEHRKAPVSDEGLVAALDSRQVVAQAQGIIMQREGSSAGEAYRALLQLADQLGMSLPACAEVVVSTADDRIANPDSVEL